jgi:hypothetical protein
MAGFFSFLAGHAHHIVGNTKRKHRNILFVFSSDSTDKKPQECSKTSIDTLIHILVVLRDFDKIVIDGGRMN